MNKIQQAFSAIKAEEQLKADTLQRVLQKKKKRYIPQIAAACAALMLISFPFYHMYTTEAAYIEIDTDIPIGLSVNAYDKIIAVSDEQYEALKGQDYSQVIGGILTGAQTEPNVYVAADSEKLRETVTENIQQHCTHAQIEYSDMESKHEADHHGVGLGKYNLITEILQRDTGKTYADYSEYSDQQLRVIYSALYGNEPEQEDVPNSGTQHHEEKHSSKHHH